MEDTKLHNEMVARMEKLIKVLNSSDMGIFIESASKTMVKLLEENEVSVACEFLRAYEEVCSKYILSKLDKDFSNTYAKYKETINKENGV